MPFPTEQRRLKYVASINQEALTEDTPSDFVLQYIDIGNVDSGGTIHEIASYQFGTAPSRARRIVKDGDVIISTVRTYLQAIASIESPPDNLIVSTGFAVVRPQPGVLHPGYCKYALREPDFLAEIERRSVGVSYPAVNASDVADISIPVLSLAEQRAIADFLDRETTRIDALVATKERVLWLLAEKRRALITRAVTRGLNPDVPMKDSGLSWLGDVPAHWDILRLKFAVTKIGSGKTPKGGGDAYTAKGIPFLRSQNVQFDGLSLADVVFIDDLTDEQMANSRVNAGDVLLNITGASIGRCCVVPGTVSQANVNQHVCILRPVSERISSVFLNAILSSAIGQHQVFAGEEGISREGLNFEDIGSFIVVLPSLNEQQAIVAYIEAETGKIDALQKMTKRTVGLLKERRAALIAAAVTGQLVVSNGEGDGDAD